MKDFKELNWIALSWCKGYPLSDGFRKHWKKWLSRREVEAFVEEVVDSNARFFRVKYEEFGEEFDKRNPEIYSKIRQIFEEKTGFFKGRLRIESDNEEIDRLLMAIVVPDINRVDVTFELFQRLPEREKVQFLWYTSKDSANYSMDELDEEVLDVYYKYHSLYVSEQVAFLTKHIKQKN